MAVQIKSRFFGRAGGFSSGIYSSLNCGGRSSGDETHNIKRNRQFILDEMGLGHGSLLSLHQIHSTDVITVKEPWDSFDINQWPKADAMVTKTLNLALGILTADCAPVLFSDAKNGVIGAAHAGWRGAFGGILENTVAAMQALGAERDAITFQIGPCIAQQSYEVSQEFYHNFLNTNAKWQQFFVAGARTDHHQFDLPGFISARLQESGVRNVDTTGNPNFDTCSNEKDYFSYRRMTLRNELDYGRQISVIALYK